MFGLLSRAQDMEREGKKVIHFELGDPNFDSPDHVLEAAKKALDQKLTHYTNSMGLRELREAVANYAERDLGFKPDLNQVLICPANALIDFTARCAADPGEEIILPGPGFPTYYSVIKYNGFVPVPVRLKEENSFRMNPDDIVEKITDKTRLIIMNTPQNPTGSVMTEEEVFKTAEIAEHSDVYLLSDEVYSKIIYGGKNHFSPSLRDKCKERTIVLGSLSKIYSMSGWRLGFAIGPESFIRKMGLLLETIMSCLPAFTQLGGKAALEGDHSFLGKRIQELNERRNLLIGGLNRIKGLSCVMPEGAFYAFCNIKGTGMDSARYCEELLENSGIAAVSGNCFGSFGEGYARFCYASTEKKEIEEALSKMEDFHKKI